MSEEWRPISFADGYQASDLGNILGRKGRILRPTLSHSGYLVCDLSFVQHRVNRVICCVFHGEPPTNRHQAAHRDSNRRNNAAVNLYWATPLENGADLAASDHVKGTANCVNALVEDDVRLIRRLREEGYSVACIHETHFNGLSYSTISHAANRRTWRHV